MRKQCGHDVASKESCCRQAQIAKSSSRSGSRMRLAALAAGLSLFFTLSTASAQQCPIADSLCQGQAANCVSGIPGQICLPQQIIVDPTAPLGVRGLNCTCFADTDCGGIRYIATLNAVRCAGNCPVPPNGNQCTVLVNGVSSGQPTLPVGAYPPGTVFTCGCTPPPPPNCTPNATGSGCNQTTCPNPGEACLPKCIRVGPNGQQTVIECQCIPDTQCHITFGSPAPNPPTCVGTCPPGFICNRTVTTNADGSLTYCCECIPAPPTCPVGDPLCQNMVSDCVNPTPGSTCRAQMIIIDSTGVVRAENCACLNDTDCGAIAYDPAVNAVHCAGVCPVPPQGNQCEVFINGVASGSSNVIITSYPPGTTFTCNCAPPPPPCTPDPTGMNCNQTTCPNPGETCLPRCIRVGPNGQVSVVDCQCIPDTRCHIIPPPAGALEPVCIGDCPPGFTCQRTATFNPADGSTTYCCECVPPPPTCPVADPLCQALATQCVNPTPGSNCRAQMIIIDAAGVIRAENCACLNTTDCGAITYVPTLNAVRCVGACPVPPTGNQCEVFINGIPSGQSTVVITPYPPGTTFTCGCAPPTPPCTPNAAGTACTQTTCPTPGQTCLPKCIRIGPNGQVSVVECECIPDTQCHIIPPPAGANEPLCIGDCPPGFTCQRTMTFNPADGSRTYCCECVPLPPTCPVADPLCQNLATNCTNTTPGATCRAQMIISAPGTPGGVIVENCSCFNDTDCGAISYIPTLNAVRCTGTCPMPPQQNQCEVLINGVPSGQSTVIITPYPPGTTFTCGCSPTPPPCTPNSTGTGCNPTTCPNPGEACLPRCIKVTANGQQIVVDCECMPDTQCHIIPGPAGTLQPICVGTCPPGFVCERSASFDPTDGSTTYCCSCRPDNQHCEPLPDGSACQASICPTPNDTCKPKCIEIRNDGTIQVHKCNCDSPDACHAEMGPAGPICVGVCPPGYTCVQRIFPTANGIAYCCNCVPDPEFCEPTANGQACTQFICPPDATGVAGNCRPKCVEYNPATGQYMIRKCDCVGDPSCYVDLSGPAPNVPHCTGNCPPGTYCVENRIENPDGTVTICCDCRPITCDCPGDINGDGVLNGLDIAGFVRCWLGTSQPGDNCACADIDGDGIYTQVDFAQFIGRIMTKAQCAPTPCCPKANLNLNLATGIDDNGNAIPVNTDDDNWVVTLDASGGIVPRPATVITPHPVWQTFPNSQWISANYFGPNGDYEYRFCFCLDDRFKNPLLNLRLRADDAGQVFLNGTFIGNAAAFTDPNPPVISVNNAALFHPGENCIVVRVQNIGGAPTGLNMIGSLTAQDGKCCCPPQRLIKDLKSGVYDVNGPFIPVGQDDDTWTVTCDATNGAVPRPAKVIQPHSAWAVIPGTRWISATTASTNGLYCYRYCFCLDPRFKNATLTMSLLADDAATVWLNGVQVGATPNGWAFLNPPTQIFVTNQSLFRPCENCIEIRVVNGGGVITGMDVSGTITADDGLCCDDRSLSCCVPGGDCVDLAPGTTQCPSGGQLIPGPCGNYAACCTANGQCQMMSRQCCILAGGIPSPAGTVCTTGAAQACCIGGPPGCNPCVMAEPACCVSVYNGTPQGPNSFCPPPPP